MRQFCARPAAPVKASGSATNKYWSLGWKRAAHLKKDLRLTFVNCNPWADATGAHWTGQSDGYRIEANVDFCAHFTDRRGAKHHRDPHQEYLLPIPPFRNADIPIPESVASGVLSGIQAFLFLHSDVKARSDHPRLS